MHWKAQSKTKVSATNKKLDALKTLIYKTTQKTHQDDENGFFFASFKVVEHENKFSVKLH